VLALAMILPLARQLPGNARWLTLGAIGCVAVALVATFLARPPQLSPSAVVPAQSTVLADWRWASRVNAEHVYGAGGLRSESDTYWLDYLRVVNAHERWAELLQTHGVGAVVISADAPLADQLRRSPEWRVDYDANGALVAERTN
jgi:YD repeat-containing protein